jgi:hypothetical protein
MKTQNTFDEQVAAAAEAGDRNRVDELYAEQARFGHCGGDRQHLSWAVLEATYNSAKKDSKKLSVDVLSEILAVEVMLAHRVRKQLMAAIHQHDYDDRDPANWGRLPPAISDVLLPRYQRITSSIFDTIKLMHKIDRPADDAEEHEQSA